jgi:hypothetical protein
VESQEKYKGWKILGEKEEMYSPINIKQILQILIGVGWRWNREYN